MVGHNASACVYPKEAVTSLVYVLISSRDYIIIMYIYVAVTCKLKMYVDDNDGRASGSMFFVIEFLI